MLGAFVAGRYAASFSAVDIGMTRQGFELEFAFKQELIDESDLYGLTTLDAVRRGCDVFLSATLKEWNAGSRSVLWPIGGGAMGKIFTSAVPNGSFDTDLAKPLVLTSTAGTAAALSPATLTAAKAWIAPNYNPRILFDSRLREVPIRLIFYPYASSSDTIAFSTT